MSWAVSLELGSRYTGIGFSPSFEIARTKTLGHWDTTLVPTSILLNQQMQFDSFGNEAEDRYNHLEGAKENWWMFKEFTSKLQNVQGPADAINISDVRGRTVQAKTVWAIAIRHMVDEFESTMAALRVDIKRSDCVFIFIVPTGWTNATKNCMKNAAVKAGIRKDGVKLVLDTEAASIMCQYEMAGWDFTDTESLAINWESDRVDISHLETKFDGTLRVNYLEGQSLEDSDPIINSFIAMIAQLCGMSGSSMQREEDFDSDLIRSIKIKARSIQKQNDCKVTFNLPVEIMKIIKRRPQSMDNASIVGDKIRIDGDVLKGWFEGPIKDTVSFIKSIMTDKKLTNLKHIILFGEFSKNQIVVESMRESFRQDIVVPEDVSVAVVRGGCLYGHCPEIVASRIVRDPKNALSKEVVSKPSLVVAAFDFGTTYSGYAYSFRNNPMDIWANKGWNSGKHISLKAPTCVLLNPKQEFHSFGYDAETNFANLAEDDEHQGWMLFRQFKMLLHNKENLNRNMLVEDINGNKLPALKIFSFAIHYLKNELLKTINDTKSGVNETDIMYVLTVPAIWNDAAKLFMKEAAIQAGIDRKRVMLALEPEAASVWCQHIQTDVRERLSKPGTQFMVADLGGGTADISVQEKQAGYTLKEIHRASGGPWGGTKVDENFFLFLTKLFGEEAMVKFRNEEMTDFFELLREFEIKKRVIMPKEDKDFITFRVTRTLGKFHKKIKGTKVDSTIESLGLQDKVVFVGDKLRVDTNIVKSWFTEPIQKTVSHVRGILKEPRMVNVETIMLVGGFGECELLKHALRSDPYIAKKKLIIPPEAGIAVLKGAVEFGMKPRIITKRVMKYTYGIAKVVTFDRQKHDRSKARRMDGRVVIDVFEQFINADSEIGIGEVIIKGVVPTEKDSTHLKIYTSSDTNPKYILEPGCRQIGELLISHPEGTTAEDKIFNVQFEFGKTEIIVKVVIQASGN